MPFRYRSSFGLPIIVSHLRPLIFTTWLQMLTTTTPLELTVNTGTCVRSSCLPYHHLRIPSAIQIYRSKWTVTKILYLICRYYPLLSWPFNIWATVFKLDLDTCMIMATVIQLSLLPMVRNSLTWSRNWPSCPGLEAILSALCTRASCMDF